jgi:transcriptional regulator with XRE-family HTH domain
VGDDIDVELGRQLRRRRRRLGLTQQGLGASIGVSFQQIQKYETATNRMSAAMVARLADALSVGVGYFFEGCEGLIPAVSPKDGAGRSRPAEPGVRIGAGPAPVGVGWSDDPRPGLPIARC